MKKVTRTDWFDKCVREVTISQQHTRQKKLFLEPSSFVSQTMIESPLKKNEQNFVCISTKILEQIHPLPVSLCVLLLALPTKAKVIVCRFIIEL